MEISAFPLPDELAERLATTTGPDGRGTIAAVAPADLAGVAIEAPGFGRQLASATPDSDGGFVFRVAPVGRLAGRVVVDDPRALQGLKLQVLILSRAEGPNLLGATAETVPDSSGRFEVPVLPVGNLYINVQVPENSTLKFITARNKSIEAGRLTEVTITEQKPAKTRTLAGRVVDAKGKPGRRRRRLPVWRRPRADRDDRPTLGAGSRCRAWRTRRPSCSSARRGSALPGGA